LFFLKKMKTITFYSYKGGVGRSLALAKIAMHLSQLKKTVCVIDFDLDAPGLRFKFINDYVLQENNKKGIVDYIYQFSKQGILPERVADYANLLVPKYNAANKIIFFSAGDINSRDYWKKLSMIRWADMFYSKEGKGIRFFLDLKAKIEKEFSPDYLLIDSRTGITDISGITLRILADEIVILGVDNKENIFGTRKILESISEESSISRKKIKVRFVLTRLPYSESPQDKEKEFQIIQNFKKELLEVQNENSLDFSVIHADRKLEENESTILGMSQGEKARLLFNKRQDELEMVFSDDYLNLFKKITEGDSFLVSLDQKVKEAEKEFSNALKEKDSIKKMVYLNRAVELDGKNYRYLIERARFFWGSEMIDKAMKDFSVALKLKPNDIYTKYALGLLNIKCRNFDKANEYLSSVTQAIPEAASFRAYALEKLDRREEAIDFLNEVLEQYPALDDALNSRADLLRSQGNYEGALKDIYKAIELNPNEVLYLATLAEIRATSGDIEGFYLSLTIGLSKGLSAKQMSSAKDVYKGFINEKRFIELMNKYQIDIDVILNFEN